INCTTTRNPARWHPAGVTGRIRTPETPAGTPVIAKPRSCSPSRREFLRVGGLAPGGLGLTDVAAAIFVLAVVTPLVLPAPATAAATRFRGEVTDSATGRPIPCRVYVEGEDGTWHFPKSEAKDGSAVEYRKRRPDNPRSVEMHTTLSAH